MTVSIRTIATTAAAAAIIIIITIRTSWTDVHFTSYVFHSFFLIKVGINCISVVAAL